MVILLEEYVKNLKAELKREIAKREESEYRHAVTAEALENLLDAIHLPSYVFQDAVKAGRKALNGVVEA